MTAFFVTYQRSYTQSQVQPPTFCASKDEAYKLATEWNIANHDDTWNAARAYVVNVQLGSDGYAL